MDNRSRQWRPECGRKLPRGTAGHPLTEGAREYSRAQGERGRFFAAALLFAVLLFAAIFPMRVQASDYRLGYSTEPSNNDYIFTTKSPRGNVGKSMSISFRVRPTDEDMNNLQVSLAETGDFQQIEERGEGDYLVDYYPFEILETTFVPKHIGNVKQGNVKSVSISARVRRDALQGYYSIPILLEWDDGGYDIDYVNVWISTSSDTSQDEEEDLKEGNYFVIGENQATPRGVYPNVLNFGVNFRNKRETTAQDVTIHMGLSEDDTKFPFEINEGNYDRTFARGANGETVTASYSMAIRKDSYTVSFPIPFTIAFRSISEGDLHTEEGTFYVHVTSKDKEDDLRDFDANDRTRARLIVDSYYTIPEEVYAGDEFELVLNMKNASSDVPASNILFNLESEKVSDSAVFTTESGTSSLVVNSLSPGQTTEVRAKFTARAGVDQRSYGITVKEKYDSPEFKNAEESIVVDIPVKQYARLSTSNIDVMPDSITVGGESNVMFGINNTGKVILYNVTVSFAGDSIRPVDSYVGNIKPGETGNVDAMLMGTAPTMDDGKVKITVSYEDENGEVSTVEKEMTLFVTEEIPMDYGDMDVGNMTDVEADQGFFASHRTGVLLAAAAAAAAAVLGLRAYKKNKRKKELQDEEEAIDDEIS